MGRKINEEWLSEFLYPRNRGKDFFSSFSFNISALFCMFSRNIDAYLKNRNYSHQLKRKSLSVIRRMRRRGRGKRNKNVVFLLLPLLCGISDGSLMSVLYDDRIPLVWERKLERPVLKASKKCQKNWFFFVRQFEAKMFLFYYNIF